MLVQHGSAHAAILTYRVEDIVFVRVGIAGEPRRVLSLRRLDRLNLERTLLGMQSEELGDPVVLLDQIEEFVASHVEPVVAGDPYPLGDVGKELAAPAGRAIRSELEHTDPLRATIATVRRHEARHGVDLDRDMALRYPTELQARVGVDEGGESHRFVTRARAELAAYLSQIACEPRVPQLALWNLASQAFHHERWGTAESYVAVVVIEGLARQRGIAPDGPLVHGGHLDMARLAKLARPLADLSDDELRGAARTLWDELYDEPFLPISDF
jgi:hypothetical protein